MPPRRDTTNSIHSGHGGRFEAWGLSNRTTSSARIQRLMEINAAHAREHEERVRAAAAKAGASAAADSARYGHITRSNEARRVAAAQDEKDASEASGKEDDNHPTPEHGAGGSTSAGAAARDYSAAARRGQAASRATQKTPAQTERTSPIPRVQQPVVETRMARCRPQARFPIWAYSRRMRQRCVEIYRWLT